MDAQCDEVGAVEGRGVAGGERFLGFLGLGVSGSKYVTEGALGVCTCAMLCSFESLGRS
jgi:hypothetical protein